MTHTDDPQPGTTSPKFAQRIAIFVPSMRGGGAERVMALLAGRFAQEGHEVDLILSQREGPYLEELDPLVNVVDLRSKRVAQSFWPLVKYLRKERPDVLLTALSHANVLAIVARAVSGRRTRLVISERGAPSISGDGTKINRWWALAMRNLYPRADAVIAVSEGVGRELVQDFGLDSSKVFAVHNPVDVDYIRWMSAQGEKPHAWLRDQSLHVFLAAGRLTQVKGFDVLLRAFSRMHEAAPSRLIILGEGPLHSKLEGLARELGVEEKVHFAGFQKNPYLWMASSDTFVLSSFSEGLPNALIQAMTCGVPLISTDCKHGAAEILENGKWGALVPVGDFKQLAEAMLAYTGERENLDMTARVEDFRLGRIASDYARVLRIPLASKGAK